MTNENDSFYDYEIRIRNYLNDQKIRLCDPPYTVNNNVGNGIDELSINISNMYSLSESFVKNLLNTLREKAIENWQRNEKYNNENISTIKVHVSKLKSTLNVEINNIGFENGRCIKEKTSELINVPIENLKLIFKGKIIDDNVLLTEQGIKNNSKILAFETINDGKNNCSDKEMMNDLNKSRNMASYLSERAKDNNFLLSGMSLDITDQCNQVIQLSNEEKSLLTYGLAMHKRAQNLISQSNYQEALLHCLEADDAFRKSNYSHKVDNVALLQLDIVWCYYCLQNMDDLNDAERRLQMCEKRMKDCYGEDNERIQKLRLEKTFEGIPELVQVFRLYLLHGIVKYYQNSDTQATRYFEKARHLHSELSVPNSLLEEVMTMGFEHEESLEALRLSKDIQKAVEYILKRREDKKNQKKQEKERKRKIDIAKRYGKTKSGYQVNLDLLDELILQSPGVDPAICLMALIRTDNDGLESAEIVFSDRDSLERDLNKRRADGALCIVNNTYESLIKEKNDIKEIEEITSISKNIIKQLYYQFDCDKDRVIASFYDENYQSAFSNMIHLTSSSSTNTSDENDQPDQPNLDIEKEIYETIGEGSQSIYNSDDLVNELEVFNKFAKFLNLPLINNQ